MKEVIRLDNQCIVFRTIAMGSVIQNEFFDSVLDIRCDR